jgi:hypothetical protein
MSFILPHLAPSRFTVPANQRVAVYSVGPYSVSRNVGSNLEQQLFAGQNGFTSAVFSAPTVITIAGGENFPVFYSIGTDAIVPEQLIKFQPTPGTLNATGAITPALIFGEIVTSTTAAAVTGTLPTGAVMDAASTFLTDEFWDWKIINTGSNTFTVAAAASGHTIVGNAAVGAGASARFRTRKTAANTFVSYRI